MRVHRFRVTKYDPSLRDERGMWDDWTSIRDIGKTFSGRRLTLTDYLDVEAKHLAVLASFIEEARIEVLQALGVENTEDRQELTEGQRLSPVEAIEVVRAMLRMRVWCRLEARDAFYIHVGDDFYLYVGSNEPSERSVDLAKRLGLFVDRDFPSPYWHQDQDLLTGGLN
jgi:hypothetical protein